MSTAYRKIPGYHPALHKDSEKKETLKKQGFYHTTAWRRVRLLALQRDHYLCQNCLKKNVFTKATEVHHVQPLEDFPSLALELSNLQSLCWDCHELTKDYGRERAARKARNNGVRVIAVKDGSEE